MTTRPKLWLTYAWVDNDDGQVDFVVQSLEAEGVEVRLDRRQLVAGNRVWPQIDEHIGDPTQSDGWAIFVTRASLLSEPCREELSYALQRALERPGGYAFPMIGIFPEPLDGSLIPAALRTRLYVNLGDPEWAARVATGIGRTTSEPARDGEVPYNFIPHVRGSHQIVEIRPRAGRWTPFVALVPEAEQEILLGIEHGPSGTPPEATLLFDTADVEAPGYRGKRIGNVVDPLHSAYVRLSATPRELMFGQLGGELYKVTSNR